MMSLAETIRQLSGLMGVSGDEFAVSEAAARLLAPYVDEVETDSFGNVTGRKRCGLPNAPKLLLDAHIDQIGLFVTHITEEGFLRFVAPGVDQRMLPGSEIRLKTREGEELFGVVLAMPAQLQKPKERENSATSEDMLVDMGLTGLQAKRRIRVGDALTYVGGALDLDGGALTGPAMDDRACFACILYALELLQNQALAVDLIVTGSTREEAGLQGAREASWRERPDFAIAVDVCHGKTADTKDMLALEVGKGPVISVGANSLPELARMMMEIARAQQIPYQVEALGGFSGTNAWSMQTVQSGVSTLIVSLPLKYMHSPVELLSVKDAENTGKLLASFAGQFAGRVGW